MAAKVTKKLNILVIFLESKSVIEEFNYLNIEHDTNIKLEDLEVVSKIIYTVEFTKKKF